MSATTRILNTLHGRLALVLAAIGLGMSSAGCHRPHLQVTQSEATPPDALVGTPFDPDAAAPYVLYPGDRLLVRVPPDPTLDQEVRIRSDGMITLPYAGDVQAANRPPAEVAETVNERYADVLKDPHVAVIVVEEAGRRVYVGGQVQAPGAVALETNSTLAQILYESGGTTPEANAEQIMVLRNRPGDGTYVLTANLSRILSGQDPDVALQPSDIVHVPETIIAQVDRFVHQYINLIIPRAVSFPFNSEIHNEPVRIIGSNSAFAPVQVTR